jgi:hypothetical protein
MIFQCRRTSSFPEWVRAARSRHPSVFFVAGAGCDLNRSPQSMLASHSPCIDLPLEESGKKSDYGIIGV